MMDDRCRSFAPITLTRGGSSPKAPPIRCDHLADHDSDHRSTGVWGRVRYDLTWVS